MVYCNKNTIVRPKGVFVLQNISKSDWWSEVTINKIGYSDKAGFHFLEIKTYCIADYEQL